MANKNWAARKGNILAEIKSTNSSGQSLPSIDGVALEPKFGSSKCTVFTKAIDSEEPTSRRSFGEEAIRYRKQLPQVQLMESASYKLRGKKHY